jgi:hypothetical protein
LLQEGPGTHRDPLTPCARSPQLSCTLLVTAIETQFISSTLSVDKNIAANLNLGNKENNSSNNNKT